MRYLSVLSGVRLVVSVGINQDVVGAVGVEPTPPNYKVPRNDGVAAARQIQLLILLTHLKPKMFGCISIAQLETSIALRLRGKERS
jgi:hypothetical protein